MVFDPFRGQEGFFAWGGEPAAVMRYPNDQIEMREGAYPRPTLGENKPGFDPELGQRGGVRPGESEMIAEAERSPGLAYEERQLREESSAEESIACADATGGREGA